LFRSYLYGIYIQIVITTRILTLYAVGFFRGRPQWSVSTRKRLYFDYRKTNIYIVFNYYNNILGTRPTVGGQTYLVEL